MNPLDRSPDEYEAASFMAGLSTANADAACTNAARKREHDDDDDVVPPAAKASKSSASDTKRGSSDADAPSDKNSKGAKREKKPSAPVEELAKPVLKAAPFFYYTDHSRDVDSDPLTLLTESGHVPNFPVKMHAILSNPDLKHIIAWDSHGRSFKILRPRQFESYILPRYFEHSRMCSFLRQVNGWGFRRLVGGDYRNSYYEEHFLRNMPWLCKKMRRPKIGEKMDIPPEYEPDLKAISAELPLPDHPISREIQVVLETIESGPKARMPFNWFVEEDLIRSSGSAKTPSKVDEDPMSSLLGTVKKEDQIRASQPYLPVDPNEKNKPEVQPALPPAASTLKVSPASENETLLFNYLRNAQKNNIVDPTGIVTQMHPAVALAQARRNHCRTDPEFLAGVAAATQHHNATMRNFFGGAVHPHEVHNFATSQGDMGAHSLLQTMLGLDQGIRGHNGLGSALGSITAFQPQATRQRDMTSNMLLEAILSERNHSNASVGGAFLPLPPQAVHRRSPATVMQREMKANLLLRAIQKHQGIEGNHGAGNATGFPSFQHQAVAHSVSPTDGNVNSSLPSQTLISGGNVHDTDVGLSHSSSGTMHYH